MSFGVGPRLIVGATDGRLIVGGAEGRPPSGREVPTDWE